MLEYLGDSVVGLSVAHNYLLRTRATGDGVNGLTERPSATVRAMVGNRGMACVAGEMRIPDLIRWEPALPPREHRLRVSDSGYDAVSGLYSNLHVNALAAAYEAIAAAVYLDGGFETASSFVQQTLLRDVDHARFLNTDSKQLESMLARKLGGLLGSVSFVASRARVQDVCEPVSSFEDLQCEVLDLQPVHVANPAHLMHYTAVILRRMERIHDPIMEDDILYVSSHFSVEGSRIAALRGAVRAIMGQTKMKDVARSAGNVVELKMREAIFGDVGERVTIRVDKEGRWMREGLYGNVKRLLLRCGVNVTEMSEDAVRQFLQQREQTEGGKEAVGISAGVRYANKGAMRDTVPRLDFNVVENCLQRGQEIELQSALREEHKGLEGNILGHETVVSGICDTLSSLDSAQNRDAVLRWYNEIGRQCVRLWSIQRGMKRVSQDRAEIIGECEKRGQMKRILGHEMIGSMDLRCMSDLQISRPMVALGICVQREDLGLQTALAWLSGAEQIVKERTDGGRDDSKVAATG